MSSVFSSIKEYLPKLPIKNTFASIKLRFIRNLSIRGLYISKTIDAIWQIYTHKHITLLLLFVLAFAVVYGMFTGEVGIMVEWAGRIGLIVIILITAPLFIFPFLSIFPFGQRLLEKIHWPVSTEQRLSNLEHNYGEIKDMLEKLLNKNNRESNHSKPTSDNNVDDIASIRQELEWIKADIRILKGDSQSCQDNQRKSRDSKYQRKGKRSKEV